MQEEMKIKVGELTAREEFGRGIIRMDSNTMRKLGIREGDIVEIEGTRKTGAIAIRAYPSDIGLNIVRMDGLVRRNAGVGVGEYVKIRKADVKEARRVTLAPAQKGVVVHISPSLLKQNIYGRPLTKGDVIIPSPVVRRRRHEGSLFEEFFGMNFEEIFFPVAGETRFVVTNTEPKGIVVVGDITEVEVLHELPKTFELERRVPAVTYEDIGGLHEAIQKVREMIELPLRHPELFEKLGIEAPKGVLLHGPPGTGKTLLAKAVANESGANFYSISGPEVMSMWYGKSEENLRKIFEEAEKNAPSIIFIDEIDSIAPKREETRGEVERRVVSQLLTLMDGLKSRGKVVVIAATNVPNLIDPALRRPGRFDREIEIGIPDKQGRKEIFQIHTRRMPLAKDVDLDKLAEITYGFTGADIAAVCREAAMHVIRRVLPEIRKYEEGEEIPKEVLEKLVVTKKDFDYALRMVEPSAMREVLIETPNVHWEDIGDLEKIKQQLKEVVEWPLKYPESFKRLGIKPPSGILLYGPPGCGKTLLAKAVATESQANFILVKGPELTSMWFGESERRIRELFRRAKQVAPCVTGESKVILWNGKEMKIEDMFKKQLVDVKVVSLNEENMKIEPSRVLAITRREVNEIYEIETLFGRVKVTGDHLLPTILDGSLTWIPAKNLRVGMYLLAPRKIPTSEEPRILIELLPDETRIYDEKLFAEFFSFKKGRIPKSLFKRIKTERFVRKSEVKEAGLQLEKKSYYVRIGKGGWQDSLTKKVKLPPELDEEIMYIHGLWFSDGFTQENSIGFVNKRKDLREFFLRTVKEKFEVEGYSSSRMSVKVDSRVLVVLFKRILEEILSLPENLLLSWLAGVMDGDGYVSKPSDEYKRIIIGATKRSNIELLRKVLWRVGIPTYSTKKHVVISGKFNLLAFKNIVKKMKHKKKKRRYKSLLMNYTSTTRVDVIPIGSLLKDVREELQIPVDSLPISTSSYSYYTRNIVNPTREKLVEIFNTFTERFNGAESEKLHKMKKLIEGEFICGKVKKIRKLTGKKFVYDLVLDKNHNFVCENMFMHNCIIFFDEIDALVPKRGLTIHEATERIVSQLLTEMSGVEELKDVVIIAATNRPDMLDPALLRPGRFDRQILVPAPDEEGRLKILKVLTKKMPLAKDVNLKKIAKETENYSGADLEAVCREAAMEALRKNKKAKEITMKEFEKALKVVKPSLSKELIEAYRRFGERFRRGVPEKMEKPEELSYVG
jgi:transitional endoplasmic reticulum ATPase